MRVMTRMMGLLLTAIATVRTEWLEGWGGAIRHDTFDGRRNLSLGFYGFEATTQVRLRRKVLYNPPRMTYK